MCLPNNLFLATLKTSRQRKRKTGNFCDRNMFVIRTAKGNVGLVSATTDIVCGHRIKNK